jgi:thymidine phosphorylase
MDQFEQAIEVLPNWKDITEEDKVNTCNKIINISKKRELCADEIKELAVNLAKSGSMWQWPKEFNPIIDICSTGGAGSLTTLLCPYFISGQNIFAPQVSVPGSIAGAIDTLGSIPDFKFQLTRKEMESALRSSKIGFTLNTSDLAPADLFLFNLRKKQGAKELADLAIASLLSKKVCSGVGNVIVDVRVGPTGNFGSSPAEAEQNSKKFAAVGESLGIKCTCILTNNSNAPIPRYGRLENVSILWSLANRKPLDTWTNEHIKTCIEIAAYGISDLKHIEYEQAIQSIEDSINRGLILNKLAMNLKSQGSSIRSIETILEKMDSQKIYMFTSMSEGYIKKINAHKIRDICEEVYDRNNCNQKGFISPIGFSFFVREGMHINKGDILMGIRIPPEGLIHYTNKINSIINIQSDSFPVFKERIYKVIKFE